MMPKITLIAVYIGALPSWISLWLKTCENNSEIQFMLITDRPESVDYRPDNVRIIGMTISELKGRFSESIGMNVSLETAYKICDYRPAFGLAFREELKDAEFWGYVDLDVFWGDICKFLPLSDIDSYDCLYHRGHLSIYRNSEYINNLFRLPHPTIRAKDVFSNPKSFWFDETAGIYQIVQHYGVSQYINNDAVGDLLPGTLRMRLNHKNFNRDHQVFMIEKGRALQLYEEDKEYFKREFMYFHFQKREFKSLLNIESGIPDSWIITPHAFVPANDNQWTIDKLDGYNTPNHKHVASYFYAVLRKRLKSILH